MSTNHHTAISSGAASNANTFNAPLGQLDAAIDTIGSTSNPLNDAVFDAATTLTISSGSITPTQALHIVAAESGTTDTLDTITAVNNSLLFLKADSGDTITIDTSLGNINGFDLSNGTLTGDRIVALFCQNSQWSLVGKIVTDTYDASNVTYSPDAAGNWNGDTDPGDVNDALDQIATYRSSIAILRDEKSTTTEGGAASATTWNARDLNTEVYDGQNIVTISSNQFTPIAGTFYLKATAPAHMVEAHRLRLYNVTGTASVDEGPVTTCDNVADSGSTAVLNTVFTANGTDAYRIDHYTKAAKALNGLGQEAGDGTNEVYLEIVLERIG